MVSRSFLLLILFGYQTQHLNFYIVKKLESFVIDSQMAAIFELRILISVEASTLWKTPKREVDPLQKSGKHKHFYYGLWPNCLSQLSHLRRLGVLESLSRLMSLELALAGGLSHEAAAGPVVDLDVVSRGAACQRVGVGGDRRRRWPLAGSGSRGRAFGHGSGSCDLCLCGCCCPSMGCGGPSCDCCCCCCRTCGSGTAAAASLPPAFGLRSLLLGSGAGGPHLGRGCGFCCGCGPSCGLPRRSVPTAVGGRA